MSTTLPTVEGGFFDTLRSEKPEGGNTFKVLFGGERSERGKSLLQNKLRVSRTALVKPNDLGLPAAAAANVGIKLH